MTVVALEATPVRVRSATLLAGAVVVLASLVAWWASVPYVVGVWHDDGVYALLGRAIASGHGFHHTQLPGSPAAIHYPPLYPLLLAAAWWVAPSFPDNISVFLALNAMLVGLAALGAFHFARARLGWAEEAAALFALAGTLGAPVLALSGALLSEPLFLAALWPVLYAADRAADSSGTTRHAIAAGACTGALMLVRSHALVLLIACVAVLAWRRRPIAAAGAVAAATLVVLPWQLWTMLATPRVAPVLEGAYGSYLGWFVAGMRDGGVPFLIATARLNARELWLLLQDRVVTGDAMFPRLLATALLSALVILGTWRLAQRAAVTALFLFSYFAIVIVWPYTPWRFLWGVWPLVLLCAAVGASWLWHASSLPWARALTAGAALLPAFGMARTEWNAYGARAWSVPAHRAGEQIAPLIAWVGRNTRPTDIVLAEGEQVISLFTGRRAAPTASFSAREYVVPRTLEASTTELRGLLALVPARFVLPLAPVQLEAARRLRGVHPGLREVAPLPSSAAFEVVP